MSTMPEFTGPTCRGSYALGSACRTCERCRWERENNWSAAAIHMPWMQAHSTDYDAGYNAGIAAASVALMQLSQDLVSTSIGLKANILRDGAKAILALMRS